MNAATQHERWLKIIANLRVDRKNNIAPHKPLLLLVISDIIEKGALKGDEIQLTCELVFRFLTFWTVVSERRSQRPDIFLPFYHMRSDGCWVPFDEEGKPTQERRRVASARLNESFYACLQDVGFRKQLRRVLIERRHHKFDG
jgi:putative restriction endonuclease